MVYTCTKKLESVLGFSRFTEIQIFGLGNIKICSSVGSNIFLFDVESSILAHVILKYYTEN